MDPEFADHFPEQGLALTGERTVSGIWHENYWFRRHEVVYLAIAAELDNGAAVLDAGCGEGFGAAHLAGAATRVTALDYDADAITHVRRCYPAIAVVRGNLVALPFADDAYDVVVSLQTVEHLWDQRGFVAECRRVLRPGGRLIVSTPNRLTFPAGNVFHATELSAPELAELLASAGELASLRGLRHGAALADWEGTHGSIVDAQLSGPPPQWPAPLADRVRTVTADDFVLDERDLDTCLDLVATVVVS